MPEHCLTPLGEHSLVQPPPIKVNVAVTVLTCDIVTVQVISVPEQAPPHSVNVNPLDALAVNVTGVPELYEAKQVVGQKIPGGELITVPPVADVVTVKV